MTGTPIPPALTLLHEHSYHYSLQGREDMALKKLNAEITEFFNSKCDMMTRMEWVDEYPFEF
jgi:hypothetical protein